MSGGRGAMRGLRCREGWAGALTVVALCLPGGLEAQMRMRMGAGVALTLPGGQLAVLGEDSAGVTVQGMVVGEGAGEGASTPGPLREGDRLLALQGEAVTTLEAVTTAYGAIPEGTEVVLRLARGGIETVVRFPRPPRQAEARSMVVQGPGGGAGAWTTNGPPGGGPGEMVIAGARIRDNDEGLPEVVVRGSDPAAASLALRVGDVILSINGRAISALAGLELIYAPLAVGDEVVLEVERAGARQSVRFAKPAAR